MASVPDRSKGRSIEIGDTVSYGNGFGTGRVTHIRGIESDPEGKKGGYSLKYKVDGKYWDHGGVKKVKAPKKGK